MENKIKEIWAQPILWSWKILFCFWIEAQFLFFTNGHIHNVVSTLPNILKIYVENDVVSTMSDVVQINVDSTLLNVLNFNVVKSFKFQRWHMQRWHMQRCFNIDLTLHDVAKSYQPKNNVETTLKCFLGFLFATFNSIAIHYIFFWKS